MPKSQPHRPKAQELRRRLHELEIELTRVRAQVAGLGVQESATGAFAVLEASGVAAALPLGGILEVVPLLRCTAVPGAPGHVLGTFLYRGELAVMLDLARYLGLPSEPSLSSQVVVAAASRTVGVVVDRVRGLVESPLLVGMPDEESDALRIWRGSKLVAGMCKLDRELVPLVSLEPIVSQLEALIA